MSGFGDRLLAAYACADAAGKAALALGLWRDVQDGGLAMGPVPPGWPDRPGRPQAPVLVHAREVPKRSAFSPKGRVALFHALAHIELNAVDLALDIVGRFSGGLDVSRRGAFVRDWLSVAADEARHFGMLQARLVVLGSGYGALPAHDGLWELAAATSGDLLARLALAPMVQEARGLDVTPAMIAQLTEARDTEGASLLKLILDDEIGHVATGYRWFTDLCRSENWPADTKFNQILNTYRIRLHPPFNVAARRKAGLTPEYDEGVRMIAT